MTKFTLRLALTVACLTCSAAVSRADWGNPPPPAYSSPPVTVTYSAPCESCPRPGLLARLRDRRHGHSCACPGPSCCPPRPGLLQRIRNRIQERRALRSPCCP